MADSIFKFREKFGIESPFGNWDPELEDIDSYYFDSLLLFIKRCITMTNQYNNSSFLFNPNEFKLNSSVNYTPVTPMQNGLQAFANEIVPQELNNDTVFASIANREGFVSFVTGLLNYRIVLEINLKKGGGRFFIKIYFFYVDNELPTNTVAIELAATSLSSFKSLLKYFNDIKLDDEERFIHKLTEKFAKELHTVKEPSIASFLYTKMPAEVVDVVGKQVPKEVLFSNLLLLKNLDDKGLFKDFIDTSPEILKCLRAIKDPVFLFEKFKTNYKLLKQLFYNIDGSSAIDEYTVIDHKLIFASIFTSICNQFNMWDNDKNVSLLDGTTLPTTYDTFYYDGDKNWIDTNVLSDDTIDTQYFLKQFRPQKPQNGLPEKTIIKDPYATEGVKVIDHVYSLAVNKGKHYFPFEKVFLVDLTEPNPNPIAVPAIYIKAIAHIKQVKDNFKVLRLGADIVGIILGIATLGASSPLLAVLGAADLALTTTDLLVALNEDELMKTPEGQEFIAAWNKIALVGGIAVAITTLPTLVSRTFTLTANLLTKAVGTTKEFLRVSLVKLILEANIANFTKDTVKVLDVVQVASLPQLGLALTKADELAKLGVFFATGEVKVGKEISNQVFIFYKGEVIASGLPKDVSRVLKNITKIGLPELEKLWQLLPKLDETGKFLTCVNKSSKQLRWGRLSPKDVEHNINTLKNNKDITKQWEGIVAEEFAKIDIVKQVNTKVEHLNVKTGMWEPLGDFDVLTNNYLVECKQSFKKNYLTNPDFQDQILKYIQKTNEKFMNTTNKTVVIAIDYLQENVELNHPVFRKLNSIAKENEIELKVITNLNQIKKLK